MFLEHTRQVTPDNGPRPAGKSDECFYCLMPLGADHAADCVCRRRTIVVQAVVEYVMAIPDHWSADRFEEHYNEGTWCAMNLAPLLDIDRKGQCPCDLVTMHYLREANDEEEPREPAVPEQEVVE